MSSASLDTEVDKECKMHEQIVELYGLHTHTMDRMAEVSDKIDKLQESTSAVVAFQSDLAATIRVASKIQAAFIWLTKWSLVGGFGVALFEYVTDHWKFGG